MAESKRRDREIRLDYAFDRLLANKLQHAYEILVPDQVRIANKSPASSGVGDEDGRDLRQGFLGQAEGRQHHCEPTAALVAFAREHGYDVPGEWIFEDEGCSGASLVRPGLERLRDLAAEGQIETVLVYAPDRLSRKYAYQVLLTEEFARGGVETVFIKTPQSATPEDNLLLQFQGMIAEYERARSSSAHAIVRARGKSAY